MPKQSKSKSKAKSSAAPVAPYEPLKVPALKRLARRGGIKRLSGDTYVEARKVLKDYLRGVIKDSVNVTAYAKRKTVTSGDVMFALTQKKQTLYM
jgi:histone H4